LFIAAARKLRSDRAHAYSKFLAIACLATMSVLALGALWTLRQVPFLVVGLLYGLAILAMVLSITITPDRAEYIKGLRRALHRGEHRPSPWADAGTNRIALFVLCAIVLIGATVAWEAIEGRETLGRGRYSQTIAIGVLVVAYFGLGAQYFALRLSRYGQAFMALFLFVAWTIPIVAGLVALASWRASPVVGQAILGLSPITGIALSSTAPNQGISENVRLFALAPAVTFAFVFNFLMVTVQRRIDLTVRTAHAERFGSRDNGLSGDAGESTSVLVQDSA
jgi:hypothetical protein